MLDRMSGGVTVMLHSPGTRDPGTPCVVEGTGIDVYAPPGFLFECLPARIVLSLSLLLLRRRKNEIERQKEEVRE